VNNQSRGALFMMLLLPLMSQQSWKHTPWLLLLAAAAAAATATTTIYSHYTGQPASASTPN